MNSELQPAEKLWAYVHGELSDPESNELTTLINQDPRLRKQVDEMRRMHQGLRETATLSRRSLEEIEAEVLRAWEKSGADAQPASLRPLPLTPARERAPTAPWWARTYTWAPALAAACILIGLGLISFLASPIQWSMSSGAPQYRGETPGARPPAYTEQQIEDYSSALARTVRREYQSQISPAARRLFWGGVYRWSLRSHFQELDGGMLAVQVEAYRPRGSDKSKEWALTIEKPEDVESRLATWGRQIASDLQGMVNP